MKAIKFLAALVLAGAMIFAPTQVTATHIERGCKAPPAKMEIPHWVADDLCKPELDILYVTRVFTRQDEGIRVIVAFYKSLDAANNQDMEQWIGSAVFEWTNEDGYGRLLVYGSATGRKYIAVPTGAAGMEV